MPESEEQYPEQIASEGVNAKKRIEVPRANSKRGYKRQEKRKSIIKGPLLMQQPF